jgi:FAD/FMN-containing dehydrogenase
MAGLLLGGGYGQLTTRFGLALDNLLGAEVVLADGRLVTADTSQNTNLFWALRGGGGNFGVVTSMRLRLHPVGELLAGIILFPWSDAESVLRGYAEIMASAPDELSVLAGLLPGPEGNPVVYIRPTWSGEPGHGQEVMVPPTEPRYTGSKPDRADELHPAHRPLESICARQWLPLASVWRLICSFP